MKIQLKEDRKRSVQKDENDNLAKVSKNQLAALEKEDQPSTSQVSGLTEKAFNQSSFLKVQRGWQRFKFGWRYLEVQKTESGKEKVSIFGPESKEWLEFVKFVGPPPQE
ncbi:Oidioi.mRNA.OKI2018_I69.PAR.g9236.t1.cds [Oikopleura dioica]|uniref:Oidioi.mRNA.OKI2018_I69.PAR.g9236.t1.cds n=1 Tax=Oikopleura dioica TaxID=34765 RepID=A0ABN7RKN4_OIKDI|nr:Oidioi.mRNA.OKI2018_I69.PAR.g9236.t1.cds [Oikopleura dioica]